MARRASDPARESARTRARLKLVQVGQGRILLVRLVPADARLVASVHERLRAVVAEEYLAFNGAVFRINHDLAIERVFKVLSEQLTPVYDPNLLRNLAALPNPWPIPSEIKRRPTDKPRIYMARVWHPEMAESLAFQLPGKPDDFLRDDVESDLERELPDTKRWRILRRDLDRVPVCVVADHYEPRVHDILDRYYDCWWDEFLAGDEWSVLPHPEPTQYAVRTLTEADFLALEVAPYADIEEVNLAYREKKEDYLNLRIPAEEWLDIDVAYQRIRRYHVPQTAFVPEAVVAPTPVVLRLRELLPEERDRVRWLHAFSWELGAIPADLVKDPAGCERVLTFLRSAQSLLPLLMEKRA